MRSDTCISITSRGANLPSAPGVPAREQPAPSVLVVDHFNPFAKIIRPALGRRGFTVYCASAPDQALAMFEAPRNRIGLVVLDIVTPSAGNLDMAAELERRRPGLPILYIAGEKPTIARISIETHAPGAVLVAPFKEEDLVLRVTKLLNMEIGVVEDHGPDVHLWERLIAASDPASSGTATLQLYEIEQAPLAAGHVAMLRAGNIHYYFQRTDVEASPYSMLVNSRDLNRARDLIAGASSGRRRISVA